LLTESDIESTDDANAASGPQASTTGAEVLRRVCCCGRLLPPSQNIGRPRTTCSTPCRRRSDVVTRKIRRRQQWIAEWRAQADAGAVAADDAEDAVALLLQDIDELGRSLTADRQDQP
jgi:hypothetical protein